MAQKVGIGAPQRADQFDQRFVRVFRALADEIQGRQPDARRGGIPGGHENDLPLAGRAADDLIGQRRPQAVAEEDCRSVLAYPREHFGHLVREDVNIGEEGLSLAFRAPWVLDTRRPRRVG
nr:hypothetical protein [Streptomyces sp. MBT33]